MNNLVVKRYTIEMILYWSIYTLTVIVNMNIRIFDKITHNIM